MKRPSAATVGLTVGSLLGAGLIGGYRADLANFERTTVVGRSVYMDAGQTLGVTGITFGQYAVSPGYGHDAALSADRFVAVQLVAETPGEQALSSINCVLRTPDGLVTAPAEESASFPDGGFRKTFTVVFESSKANLVGTDIVCDTGSILTYREPAMVVGLGVTRDNVDQIWNGSAHQKVAWPDEVEETLP